MAGNVFSRTPVVSSIQVEVRPRDIWAPPYLCGRRFPRQNALIGDQTAAYCRMYTYGLLPKSSERTSKFQVFSAKEGFGGSTQSGSQPKKKSKKTRGTSQLKEKKDLINLAQEILAKNELGVDPRPQEKNELGVNPRPEENSADKEEYGKNVQLDKTEVGEEAPNLVTHEVPQSNAQMEEENFERRLTEIKRKAEEQKVLAELKKYGPIDYDAPTPASTTSWGDNLGAKIGGGVVVVVFGLIFALGDFLPSGSPKADRAEMVEKRQLTKEESSKLKAQVKQFEDVLENNPEDLSALEGSAVSYAELGEFDKAEQYLSKIVKNSPGDSEALRLLAEVQTAKGDFDASLLSYQAAIKASTKGESAALLQGLTDTLLTLKKQSEAVNELLTARSRIKYSSDQRRSTAQQVIVPSTSIAGSSPRKLEGVDNGVVQGDQIDPITLELLLGKAYAAWEGHTGDAVSVYDKLIDDYPEDYRGYLAKGVLLKGLKNGADAERLFIQARYWAPPTLKSVVDFYSGRRPS